MRYLILLTGIFIFLNCLDPVSLGEPIPRTPGGPDSLAIPLNITKAYTPTGYFWNVWAPANFPQNTVIDPVKWRTFLTYESIAAFENGCDDRVSPDLLTAQDTIPGGRAGSFYTDYTCTKFTYSPHYTTDLFGGVFWLRDNNFGAKPGAWVGPGATRIVFWARALLPSMADSLEVEFGAGVTNHNGLKPSYFFTKNIDWFGAVDSNLKSPYTGLFPDTVPGSDSMIYLTVDTLTGRSFKKTVILKNNWTRVTIAINNHVPGQPLPSFQLIGAFYWAMTTSLIQNAPKDTVVMTVRDTIQTTDINPKGKYIDTAGYIRSTSIMSDRRPPSIDPITGDTAWVADTTFPPLFDPVTHDTLFTNLKQATIITPRATIMVDGIRYE